MGFLLRKSVSLHKRKAYLLDEKFVKRVAKANRLRIYAVLAGTVVFRLTGVRRVQSCGRFVGRTARSNNCVAFYMTSICREL